MKTIRKMFENKYLLGCISLIIVFIYMNMRLPEYQRQYWEDSDLIRISGAEMCEYLTGVESIGNGAVRFNEEDSEILWEDDTLKGVLSIRFYITELSVSCIRTLITADGKTGEIYLTKGENIYSFTEPVREGKVLVFLPGTKDIRMNWDRILFEKRKDSIFFFNTMGVILLCLFCAILSTEPGETHGRRRAFCIFFILAMVFYQVRNVFYYFDDYGYLSLSYQNLYQLQGKMRLTDILLFLRNHYQRWGGRVLYFFLLIIYGRNIWVIRAALCIHIFVMLLIMGKLAGYEKKGHIGVLDIAMPALLYALIEVDFLRDGAYWFTAAVLYVFPIPWLLLGVILFYQESFQDRKTVIWRRSAAARILCCPILFLASCSQEQIGLCATVIIMLATVEYVLERRKIELFQIASNVACWIGCAILLAAPGNYIRLQESMMRKSIIECIDSSLHIITSDSTKYMTIALMIVVNMVSVTILRKTTGKMIKMLTGAFAAAGAILGLIMLFGGYGMLTALQTIFRLLRIERLNDFCNVFLSVYLVGSWALLFIWYTFYHKLRVYKWFLSGATVIIGVSFFSPDVSRRMILPALLLIIVVMGEIIVNFAAEMKGVKIQAFAVLLAVITALAGLNYHYIMYGYYKNASPAEYNMNVLQNFEHYADDNLYVLLKKNKDDTFGNMMPYMPGYDFILGYMKKMYNIPDDAILRWSGRSEPEGGTS